ncbi:hypothetical protein I5Q34_16185 [Streptomyces sp. AV19]|uniref:hypothetical protein n=1 Tax=Streptomyces sp. AV19 TaxID=2793068 RepID=UPI0018FE6CA0|nr:hypothetical protein [Streptomyces sp. AV19]MBH1935791.1 hypothetical protein [Streptomyces sp. AV19]MDG4536093.1 hypothetical protein [Streptomyces sp. AV19]
MTRRRGTRAVLSAIALVAATTAWAPTAQAGHPSPFDCTGHESITYGGLGLSSEPTSVTVDGTYRCTDPSGHVVTAPYHTEGTTPGTCLLFASNQSVEKLRYSDGSTSVIVYKAGTSTRVLGFNVATLHGVVTEGRGKGSAAEKAIRTIPGSLPTDCVLAGGLRHTTAVTHLKVG